MGGDGKIVENAKQDVDAPQRIVNEVEKPLPKRESPPGTTPRTLTMRDRNFIVAAVRHYLKRPGQQTNLNQIRASRVEQLLKFDETIEYFAQVKDDVEHRQIAWDGEHNLYVIWNQVNKGAVSLENVKKQYPHFEYDPKKPYPKPEVRRPVVTDTEETGPEDTFDVPIKLESWIQDVLKASTGWDPDKSKGAAALLLKYGVLKEDDL